ncbi:hypothetical protein GGE12_006968 [Rhizobium mongolense]|uniref:Uncharacterized protein n=1 Tax=Rhizobium mongolense TaxID=57676 RepID=A0A7W6WIL1_9HYPH|nr:hypothetical protein [Rhizobium mongolense]
MPALRQQSRRQGSTKAMMEKAMNSVEWPDRPQRLTEGRLIAHAAAGAEIWTDGSAPRILIGGSAIFLLTTKYPRNEKARSKPGFSFNVQ